MQSFKYKYNTNLALLLTFPTVLFGSNFHTLIDNIDTNLLIKSKQEQTKALKKDYFSQKANNKPTIDIELNTIRLNQTPTTTFILGNQTYTVPIGTQNNITAQLFVSYPIFTGYAITTLIDKANLNIIKNQLETENLKRKLYLRTSTLYSKIYSLSQAIKASQEAKISIIQSYKKAKGLYNNGLINISNLYSIEVKQYEIDSIIKNYQEQKESLENELFYITNTKISIKQLPKLNTTKDLNKLYNLALQYRADLKVILTNLKIDQTDISLIKSKNYPTISLIGAYKKQGDSLTLNGNGFTNSDQSYIGINIKYNLFDAHKIKYTQEAALLKKHSREIFFNDYKISIKKDLKNSLLRLDSLTYQLKTAQKQILAAKSYYKLIKGRFENSLASGDELSRSIATLAQAKANKENIKAKIFLQKSTILLLCGKEYFLKNI